MWARVDSFGGVIKVLGLEYLAFQYFKEAPKSHQLESCICQHAAVLPLLNFNTLSFHSSLPQPPTR